MCTDPILIFISHDIGILNLNVSIEIIINKSYLIVKEPKTQLKQY